MVALPTLNLQHFSPCQEPFIKPGIDHPIKLLTATVEDEDLMKTISFASEIKVKDCPRIKGDRKNNDNLSLFTSSANLTCNNQYNLFAAISNKRSAFKELEHEQHIKQPKLFPRFENVCHSISNSRLDCNAVLDRRKVSEKGVQCQVEKDDYEDNFQNVSSSDQLGSLSSRCELKLTQSERLHKPNLILLPGRASDPCIYSRIVPDVHMDTTVSDSLSIDPLNVSANLSSVPGQMSDEAEPLMSPQLIPGIYHTTSKPQLSILQLEGSREQKEKLATLDGTFAPLDVRVNIGAVPDIGHDIHFDPSFVSVTTSKVRSGFLNKLNIGEKIETEVRKLDLFDDCIRIALDKCGANGRSTQELNKLNIDENIETEQRRNSPSDISLLASRDTSFEKSFSSSLPFEPKGGDVSFMNFAKFSLNMFIDLLKEESLRSKQQESHFKMRESSIVDKTKAEIAYLELEKKKFKVSGNEEGVRNVRKKIRGLIMKLQQNLEDLQRVKKMEKAAYRGRRVLLLEKIDLLKEQLKKQIYLERKAKKDAVKDVSHSSLESNKEPIKESVISFETKPHSKVGSSSDKQKWNKDIQESWMAWKQKVEEGERRIQQLETLIKDSTLTGKDVEPRNMVDRGTSPLLRLNSDDDRKKGDCSYSDTLDQLSTSSQHEKLEDKDARKMIALKIPLSPRVILKRRHSSGSDESLLLSQTETQSDASDMETRVLALQQQLKQRKAELVSLHREYKRSQHERLIAKEQYFLSQIQAYDVYIDQVKKELEKEKDWSEVKTVKPVIKHPKLSCERRKSDTWLMQERGKKNTAVPVINNIGEINQSAHGEHINKSVKDDKFYDEGIMEKLTLKTDFSAGNSENCQLKEAHQFVSNNKKISEFEKSHAAKIDDTRHPKTAFQGSDVQTALSSFTPASEKEGCLSKLVPSKDRSAYCSSKSTVREQIDFYEMLNETSHSSVDSNVDTGVNQNISERSSFPDKFFNQDVTLNESNLSSASGTTNNEEVRENFAELKSNIDPDFNSVYEQSTVSLFKSVITAEEREHEESNATREIEEVTDDQGPKQVLYIVATSHEKIGFIDTVAVSESQKNCSCNLEEDSEVKYEASAIMTEISEGDSTKYDQIEISSEIDRTIYNNDLEKNRNAAIIDKTTDDSVKEELLSEVPENIGEIDNDRSKSMEEESLNEDISELISVNKVQDSLNSMSSNEYRSKEEVYNYSDAVSIEKAASSDEVEEVEELAQTSYTKKESIIEEAESSIDFDEPSSGASFPLPIIHNKKLQSNEVKVNAVSEEYGVIKDDMDVQHTTQYEIESMQSEMSFQERQTSSVVEELDTAMSQSEQINSDLSKIGNKEEQTSEVEETVKEPMSEQVNSNGEVSEDFEEEVDLDRSISESLVDVSIMEEVEDSDEDMKRLSMKASLLEEDEEYESSDSFIDDKEVYSLLKHEDGDRKAAAPLIDALQREGDSNVDQIWRGIADTAVDVATDLVISTFFNKAYKATSVLHPTISLSNDKHVGDSDDDDWDGQELQRKQAAEAEILRLQQLQIDKEIEELEEEEARRYYYIRAIPDKPPPPYTPRRSSLVASVVEAAGEIWDGRADLPSSFMAGCHLREFLWDLASELVMRVKPPTPPSQPPWVHTRRRRPKLHIRTREELLQEVEKEAEIYLGVKERECRENLIIRWSRKRRDHVDEILVKESQEEEWEWTDYSEEENIIKNRIADAIIQDSLTAATVAITKSFVKKFKE